MSRSRLLALTGALTFVVASGSFGRVGGAAPLDGDGGGAVQGGPYTAACDTNPIAAVPDFSPIWVALEPGVLSGIAKSCTAPVTKAADAFGRLAIDMGMPTAVAAATGAESLLKTMLEAAGGVETYLAECVGSALWDRAQATLPQPVQDAVALGEAVGKLQSDLTRVVGRLKKALDAGQPASAEDVGALYKLQARARDQAKNMATLQELGRALSDVTDRPEAMLPDELELQMTATRAAVFVQELPGTCRISQAELALGTAANRGTALLTRARLAAARAAREESALRSELNRLYPALQGRQTVDSVAAAAINGPAYQAWVSAAQRKTVADEKRRTIETSLREVGTMCGTLRERAYQVQARRTAFGQLVEQGRRAIASCQTAVARDIARQLSVLEDGTCGSYLSGVSDLPTDVTGSSPFVPGGAAPDLSLGRPSAMLAAELSAADGKCGGADARFVGSWVSPAKITIELNADHSGAWVDSRGGPAGSMSASGRFPGTWHASGSTVTLTVPSIYGNRSGSVTFTLSEGKLRDPWGDVFVRDK